MCIWTVPLIVSGADSPYFNPKFANLSETLSSQVTATLVENAGHLVMVEQSAVFNEEMLQWLQK